MGEQVQQVDGGMAGMGQMRKGHVAKVCSVGRGAAMLAASYLFYTRYVIGNQVKLLQLVRCTHGGCLAMVAAMLIFPYVAVHTGETNNLHTNREHTQKMHARTEYMEVKNCRPCASATASLQQ